MAYRRPSKRRSENMERRRKKHKAINKGKLFFNAGVQIQVRSWLEEQAGSKGRSGRKAPSPNRRTKAAAAAGITSHWPQQGDQGKLGDIWATG